VDIVWVEQEGHLPIAAFFQSVERPPHELDTRLQVFALNQIRASKGFSDVDAGQCRAVPPRRTDAPHRGQRDIC
jgi:hypothetical protein